LLGKVLDATESKRCVALEWRASVRLVEHLSWFIPAPAEDVAPAFAGFVPTPLLDVTCHVIRSEAAHTVLASGPSRTATAKIAIRKHVGAEPRVSRKRGSVPVIDSGNRLLHDGLGNGLARFDRDVVTQTGVTHVIVLLGNNDISFGELIFPSEVVTGIRSSRATGN
jgi:hypothetical protein